MFDKRILEMKDEIIQEVRKSVKIKSVQSTPKENMPFGEGVNKSLKHALELANKLGFRTRNLDNMVGYAEYGEGKEMVAILGHLDVVPEGDGWTYPPYSAEIHDGKIFGRGTLDDKGPIIGALFALKAIKDSQLPLKRRIRVIFGTNEESGSKGIKYYTDKDEIPVAGFTPDAEYPIINAEKGIVTFTLRKRFGVKNNDTRTKSVGIVSFSGGTVPNVVPEYAEVVIHSDKFQKDYLIEKCNKIIKMKNYKFDVEYIKSSKNFIVKVYGISAHGSTPEQGKNAISAIIHLLSELDISTDIKETMTFLNKNIGYETDGRTLGIDLEDEISGKLTFNLGTIKGNNNEISLGINIRYPVTKQYDDFMKNLTDKMLSVGFIVEDIKHKAPLYVSPEEDFIKKLQKVYKEKTGNEPKLLAIGGGTYAKAMKNIVAFGPIFPGEPDVIHQPDEYITIENLIKNVQIMASAIYELAN